MGWNRDSTPTPTPVKKPQKDGQVNKCVRSDNSPDFKKPFEIVDLTKCHGNKNQSLKEWPEYDPRVGVVVDYKNTHMHGSAIEYK